MVIPQPIDFLTHYIIPETHVTLCHLYLNKDKKFTKSFFKVGGEEFEWKGKVNADNKWSFLPFCMIENYYNKKHSKKKTAIKKLIWSLFLLGGAVFL